MSFRHVVRIRVGLALGLAVLLLAAATAARAENDAEALLNKARAMSSSAGFRLRVQLLDQAVKKPAQPLRLLIQGIREGGMRRTLVLGLTPAAVRGHGVVMEQSANHFKGFAFTPPAGVRPLTAADLSRSLFDTLLSAADFSGAELDWAADASVGPTAVIGDRSCRWVTQRAPQGAASPYGKLRSCISEELAATLRTEKFDRKGLLARSFTMDRLARLGKRWVARSWTVKAGRSTAHLEVLSADLDAVLGAEDFTVAALKRRTEESTIQPGPRP